MLPSRSFPQPEKLTYNEIVRKFLRRVAASSDLFTLRNTLNNETTRLAAEGKSRITAPPEVVKTFLESIRNLYFNK